MNDLDGSHDLQRILDKRSLC